MKILPTLSSGDFTKQPLFFGEPAPVARYDIQRYPFIERQIRKQLGQFWIPEEISLTHDKREFNDVLSDAARHMFTSNIKYQIVLDTIQSRAPNLALLPIVSCPALETWIETWAFFETIHSRSYTHIIRGLYNDPAEVLDHILDVPEILERAAQSTAEYDKFLEMMNVYRLYGEGPITVNTETSKFKYDITLRDLQKQLYKLLVSIYILEGIRFYVSFACSWAFAETMHVLTKNAKIIKFIARDENLHMGTLHQILRLMATGEEGDVWAQIAAECKDEAVQMFADAAQQEKDWAKYLFKDGSIIGLNAAILSEYVEFITDRRMKALGLKTIFGRAANPLPWTENWTGSKNNQPPPQEVELNSYTIGGVDTNVDLSGFDGLL